MKLFVAKIGETAGLAPFAKGGGRPQSGRRGICSSREKQIPHKPLSRLAAPFCKGGTASACDPGLLMEGGH